MRPRERRETGEQDLFRSRLDQIIDMRHSLVTLARTVDWGFLEQEFGVVYTDGPGQPPLPTRLMAGLAILKHTYDLSDEVLCERWVENPYYQYFCGEEFFQHRLVFDRSSLTRWRNRMGEERLQALLQESLSVAVRTKAQLSNVANALGWGRQGNYKAADSFDSFDLSVSTWDPQTKTCLTACHVNQPGITWGTGLQCSSCHANQ